MEMDIPAPHCYFFGWEVRDDYASGESDGFRELNIPALRFALTNVQFGKRYRFRFARNNIFEFDNCGTECFGDLNGSGIDAGVNESRSF